MHKTIDDAINETAEKIAIVINESGLPISILKLMLTNTLLQLQQIPEHKPSEEAGENAKSES